MHALVVCMYMYVFESGHIAPITNTYHLCKTYTGRHNTQTGERVCRTDISCWRERGGVYMVGERDEEREREGERGEREGER